jgi:hypothetical protein
VPTLGAYEFRRALAASPNGVVEDENQIQVGEWAWLDRTAELGGDKRRLFIYIRDPDCRTLATLFFQDGDTGRGHAIDKEGNVTPSVYHKWPYGDPPQERCGFHTSPTRLLGFIDLRRSP